MGCPYDCYTCNSNGTCITCDDVTDHREFNSDTLRCDSQRGYFDNQVTISVKCIPSCSSCLSYTFCTSCNSGYSFQPNNACKSLNTCSPRMIYNNRTQGCQMCPYDCFSCIKNNACESCSSEDTRQLDLKTLRCIPLSRYFDNKTTVCVACPNNC